MKLFFSDFRGYKNPVETKQVTAETIKKSKQLNSSEVLNLQDFMEALESSSINYNKNGLVFL